MKHNTTIWLAVAFLLTFTGVAQAAIFCNVTSPGFSTAYVTANTTTNITSTSFTVTCTRDNAGGRRNRNGAVSYQVTVNNGRNALGTQNRAAKGAARLNYSVSTVATCATPWKGRTPLPTIAANFNMAINTTVTNVYTFYGCVPPLQAAAAPAGIYTDTVTMTIARPRGGGGRRGNVTFTNGTFPVTIIAPASCTLTTPPSTVAIISAAFRATPAVASSSFALTCSNLLPFTMALDATVGVVTGLNYTLSLNTVNTGGTNPLISVGNGLARTFFINGTMAAGQAGTCAGGNCTGAQIRTLTITY